MFKSLSSSGIGERKMTVQIRTFAHGDLPILVRLLNAARKGAYEFVPYTQEKLGSWIEEGRLKILMALENNEVLGSVAYDDGHWGEEIEWLTVVERPDQRALENKIVSEVEKYVRGQSVFTAVDAGSPRISEWLERGYKLEGGLLHMIAKLDGVKPLPKIPVAVLLRSLRQGEEVAFVEVVNKGFGWERLKSDAIREWKADFPGFNEDWIHVAEAEGKIVSFVVAKEDLSYNGSFGGKRGYLGPAATLPEYRGKNIASALTVRAMNFLFEKGMDSAALYTGEQNAASVTLLQKLGFNVSHNWKFMRKHFDETNRK
jgi:ribosomal protein S18 acetylase RimI-like enzyme